MNSEWDKASTTVDEWNKVSTPVDEWDKVSTPVDEWDKVSTADKESESKKTFIANPISATKQFGGDLNKIVEGAYSNLEKNAAEAEKSSPAMYVPNLAGAAGKSLFQAGAAPFQAAYSAAKDYAPGATESVTNYLKGQAANIGENAPGAQIMQQAGAKLHQGVEAAKGWLEKHPTVKKLGEDVAYTLAAPGGVGLAKEAVGGAADAVGGAAGIVGNVTKGAVNLAGETTEKVGQRALAGELKIKQSLAKSGYGGNIEEKKKNIIKTIQEHKLVKPLGNFDQGIQDANDKISAIQTEREGLLEKKSTGPNAVLVNPVDLLNKTKEIAAPENIMGEDIKTKVALGKFDQANSIIDGIVEDAKKAGLDKSTTLKDLMRITKVLDPDGRLFNKGAYITKDDALDDVIRKDMYFNILDEVEKSAPQVRQLGREQKRLIDAKSILIDAQSRIVNKHMTSVKGIGSSVISGELAHALGAGTPEAVALAAAIYGIGKAGKQGRFAAAAMRAGEALKKFGKDGGYAEGSRGEASQAGGEEGINRRPEEGVHLRDDAGKVGVEAEQGKEVGIPKVEPGALSDEEAAQVLRRVRAPGVPGVTGSEVPGDISQEVRDRFDFRNRTAQGAQEQERSVYADEQPVREHNDLGEALAQKHGVSFEGAVPGDRNRTGVLLNFKDDITGKPFQVSAKSAEVDLPKIVDRVRQENPEEYGKAVAEQAGVEYVGQKEQILSAKGADKYNTEMRASYKTLRGNEFTLPLSSKPEEVKLRAEEMDKNTPAEKATSLQQAVPQGQPILRGRELNDADRIVNMYIKTGRTETGPSQIVHKKMLDVINQVYAEDIATAAGLTPKEVAKAVEDIKGLRKSPEAEKVRQALAPSLFYGEPVEEVVQSIKQGGEPRSASGEVMFQRQRTSQQQEALQRIQTRVMKDLERTEEERTLEPWELAEKRANDFRSELERNGLYYNERGELSYANPKIDPEAAKDNWARWERDIAESIDPTKTSPSPFAQSQTAERAEVAFQRQEPTEAQNENYQDLRRNLSEYNKKPKVLSDKARKELESAGYRLPEKSDLTKPVKYDFKKDVSIPEGKAGNTEARISSEAKEEEFQTYLKEYREKFPKSEQSDGDVRGYWEQGAVLSGVSVGAGEDLALIEGTPKDHAHGVSIASRLNNVEFKGVQTGLKVNDEVKHQPLFIFQVLDNQGRQHTSIALPLDATAGQVAKRRMEALRGDVRFQIQWEEPELRKDVGKEESKKVESKNGGPKAKFENLPAWKTPEGDNARFQKGGQGEVPKKQGRNLPTERSEARDPGADNVSGVMALKKAIERQLPKELPKGSIEAVGVPKTEEHQMTDRLVSEVFGKKAVWFKMSDEVKRRFDIGGAVMSGRPGEVFINESTKKPVIVTGIHEGLHVMQREHPDLYNDLKKAMLEEGTGDFTAYQKKMVDKGYTGKEALDESIAEISGERFTDHDFLRRLADKSPEAFRKFVQLTREAIAKIRDWVKKSDIEHAGKYFRDLDRVDSALQDAVIQMRKRGVRVEPKVKEEAKGAKSIAGDMAEFSRGEIKPVSEETIPVKSESPAAADEIPKKKRNTYSIKKKAKKNEET
jgi:hypothetical protein